MKKKMADKLKDRMVQKVRERMVLDADKGAPGRALGGLLGLRKEGDTAK